MQCVRCRYCVTALANIAIKLAEDIHIDELFPIVVSEATKLMGCDRATLFLVRNIPGPRDEKMLWSRVALGVPSIELKLRPNSIAGATVIESKPINVPNAYADDRFDPAWDRKTGYKTRSILCVPVINAEHQETIGCLQMINKKDRFDRTEGVSFAVKDVELAHNLCSVVAMAISKAAAAEATQKLMVIDG